VTATASEKKSASRAKNGTQKNGARKNGVQKNGAQKKGTARRRVPSTIKSAGLSRAKTKE
jgi:hypothetical protein